MSDRLQHPVDLRRRRHYCQDETATTVSGRWFCQCWGGPYFVSENLRLAYRAQREINEREAEQRGLPLGA